MPPSTNHHTERHSSLFLLFCFRSYLPSKVQIQWGHPVKPTAPANAELMVLAKYGFEMDSSSQKNPWRSGFQYTCIRMQASPATAISSRFKVVEKRLRVRSVIILKKFAVKKENNKIMNENGAHSRNLPK